MENFLKRSFYPSVLQLQNRRYLNTAGNVLVYVVVLMLIFGALGVVMVSMFTSSTASTVTRNDTRRARYMSESGVRYATSELRKADFEEDIIIDPLNTLTYTVSGAGSFDINIFGPWFDSNASVDSPPDISLSTHLGELPEDFTASAVTGVWVVNYDYVAGLGPDITTMRDSAASYTRVDATNLTIDITGDFVVDQGERVCLAVEPTQAQSLNEGEDLFVFRDARLFFPPFNGAVNINRVDYAYERLVDDPDNNRVILENLTASQFPNTLPAFPLNVAADTGGTYSGDFVVLSPRNYMVMAEGTSDSVSWGNTYAQGVNVYDDSLIRPDSRQPDITADEFTSNLSEQETDTRVFEVDTVADTLRIGRGLSDQFGSAFYAGDESIGGDQDYCAQGACLFALGVRVSFLVNFSQQGEGITFTLLGKGFPAPLTPNNSASSVGGDVQLSELMGYAGDSRLVPNANPSNSSDFLATNPDDRGLDPPKIAVEFDTRTNNAVGDPPPDYCADAITANTFTRNDPLPDGIDNKDAVQYVFWGRTSFLNIPCRDNNTLYDDNRHDADGEEPKEEWRFGTGGAISIWRPAIGSDGTIYMSALDATLYALNPSARSAGLSFPQPGEWSFNLGDNNDYMPGIDTKGTADPSDDVIYSDIAGNSIVAIDSDGNELWRFGVASDIDSTPIAGPDGRVYFGTDAAQSLFAIDPDDRAAGRAFPQPGEWQRPTGGRVSGVAALSPDASVVYFVADGPDNNLYAVNTADGSIRWKFPLLADPGELNSSPVVNPADGTIYVGSDNKNVYAINPTNGTEKWRFTTGADVESSPFIAIDPIDGIPTVYIGSDDDNVYALNAETGAKKWEFTTGGPNVVSSPVVDLDGTIYIGSEDGKVYAFNPNGTEKWNFPTGGQVRSSPAIGQAGFIHIGSNDTNFYTISQFADPRNFKDENKIEGKLLTSGDLDSSVLVNNPTDWLNGAGSRGSWAVRLEVDRSLVGIPNALGELEYDYELRLWMRQCSDPGDIPCDEILGTFYQDTRIEYDYTAVEDLPMRQSFSLSGAEQDAFESFFFGFTGAAGAEALDVTISQFQLSFIRPGDPVVDCDKLNWPVEAPVPDCLLID